MNPLIIAHRGNPFERPENTLASFAAALEVGAQFVELDVQLTRDGKVVVIHDALVDRTTNGRGRVGEMTLAEIRRLSAGYPERFGAAFAGERVPTLAEALGLLRDRARVMIEIKADSVGQDRDAGIEALTVREVRRAGMSDQVAFLSFDRLALLRARELAPEIPRGYIFHGAQSEAVLEGARAVGCDVVMPHKEMLSEGLAQSVREAGLRMATWVVDDPAELRALAVFDLYAVASNRPGLLLEALEDQASSGPT